LSAFGCVLGDGERLLCLFNAGAEATSFLLPAEKWSWDFILDSGRGDGSSDLRVSAGAEYVVAPHSFMLFRETPA
jgi:pullulanase/glycogen debranching enzyme